MILECYSLLKKIEEKPQMYIGGNRLQDICIFITGYYYALIDYKIITKPEEIDSFFDWIAQKLGFSESTAGWVNMIVAVSVGLSPKDINWNEFISLQITNEQHQKSISFFYNLLEEFKHLKSN